MPGQCRGGRRHRGATEDVGERVSPNIADREPAREHTWPDFTVRRDGDLPTRTSPAELLNVGPLFAHATSDLTQTVNPYLACDAQRGKFDPCFINALHILHLDHADA
jgi:hypothetical protein